MTESKSFVIVNLELIQAYDLSFFEAGLLERIRYFSEFDQSGSGWCYVGKERLSKEFGVSKPGLLKAIGRLIERNLLIRNDKGWLRCNLEGVNKVDCKQSLPVNKVDDRGKLSLPNNILKDNIDNSNSSSLVLLGKQSLLPAKQSLPVNKVSTWNPNEPDRMVSLPGKTKKKLTEEQFVQVLLWEGKKPVPGFELIWLTDTEMNKLVSKLDNDINLAKKAIETVYRYKVENGGIREYVSDYLACSGYGAKEARYSAKSAGYDPSKERQKEKIRKDNLNLFNEA
jgi:hypothetical protein